MAALMGKDVKKLKAKGGGKCTYVQKLFFLTAQQNLSPKRFSRWQKTASISETIFIVQLTYLEKANLIPK